MNLPQLDWTQGTALLLALLVAGHLLADFVLQPWRMVAGKRSRKVWLLAHGAVVLGAHAALLAPFHFAEGFALVVAGGLALSHVAIDQLKIGIERVTGRRLAIFLLDQGAHLAVIVAVWHSLGPAWLAQGPGPLLPDPGRLGPLAVCAGIFAFAINGGSAIVAGVLRGMRPVTKEDDDEAPHAGHLIGILERLALVPLVWIGQWGAIGFVLAAKSVARFKALEERAFAEVYLVGTLTSFLVAFGCGWLLRWLVPLV